MKRCPYCGKIYESEIIKVCPLMHCPSCGSTSLYIVKNHSIEEEFTDPTPTIWGSFVLVSIGIGTVFMAVFFYYACIWQMDVLVWFSFIPFTTLFLAIVFFWDWISTPIHCKSCGKKFHLPKKNIPLIPVELTVKKCPNCGTIMPKDAKFCGKCGTKLD